MARSTGPILAVGAITLANSVIFHGQPLDLRVPIATGIAAGMFALAEKGFEQPVVLLAYVSLVTVLFVRLQPGVPAPVESALSWWNGVQ